MGAKKFYPKKNKKRYNKKQSSGWANSLSTVAKIASTAMTVAKGVASIVNAEDKLIDTSTTATLTGSNGIIIPLTLCSEGNDDNNRNGRSILSKSNFMRFMAQISDTGSNYGVLRWILFIDNFNQGGLPNLQDILQSIDALSPLNIRTQSDQRFTIIKDKCIKMVVGQENQVSMFKHFVNLSHHIKYGGTAATNADQRNGGIYLLLLTKSNTATFTYYVNNRFRFYDN